MKTGLICVTFTTLWMLCFLQVTAQQMSSDHPYYSFASYMLEKTSTTLVACEGNPNTHLTADWLCGTAGVSESQFQNLWDIHISIRPAGTPLSSLSTWGNIVLSDTSTIKGKLYRSDSGYIIVSYGSSAEGAEGNVKIGYATELDYVELPFYIPLMQAAITPPIEAEGIDNSPAENDEETSSSDRGVEEPANEEEEIPLPSDEAQSPSVIREYDIETIARLGQEIYQQDIIAARATDILFSQQLDLSSSPIIGWVVTEDESGALVTFVGDYEGDYRAVFEVRPESSGENQFKSANERELSTEELSRFRAQEIAQTQVTTTCSERYNGVVLKDPASDAWLVYLLAATTDPDLILVGGHYRVTVSANGQNVQSTDKLFKSCLTMSKPPSRPNIRPVALAVTHVVSPTPVETHVFLSLLHNTTLAVGTLDGVIWGISEGQISRLEENEERDEDNDTSEDREPRVIEGESLSLNNDAILGDVEAPITIIEYSDYNCPFCARFHAETLPLLIRNYISTGKANFVYRDVTIIGRSTSESAASASLCVGEQLSVENYLDFINSIYLVPRPRNAETVQGLSQDLSINRSKLNNCIADQTYKARVQTNTRHSRDVGARGTPMFVIGKQKEGQFEGIRIPGAISYDDFAFVLDELSEKLE